MHSKWTLGSPREGVGSPGWIVAWSCPAVLPTVAPSPRVITENTEEETSEQRGDMEFRKLQTSECDLSPGRCLNK